MNELDQKDNKIQTIPKWQLYTITSIFILGILSWIAISTDTVDKTAANDEPKIVKTIWEAFINYPENGGKEVNRFIGGKLVRKGTVDPSALATSTKSRLPAYIACYQYNLYLPGIGDQDSEICVSYIGNPTKGTHAILWRSPKDLDFLEQALVENGFIPEGI